MLTPSEVRRAASRPLLFATALFLVGCFVPPNAGAPVTIEPASSPSPLSASPTPTMSYGVPPIAASPSTDGPPPLNRMELKVIEALAQVGVTGQRAEFAADDASIWAQMTTGLLFVTAGKTSTRGRDFTVIEERQIEGIRVQRIQYSSGPPVRHRFECSDDAYVVWGAVPPSAQNMESLVARLIRALRCGG